MTSYRAARLAKRKYQHPPAAESSELALLHFLEVNQRGCVNVLTNSYSTPLPVGISRSHGLLGLRGDMARGVVAWRGINAAISAIGRYWNWITTWMCS